MSMCWLHARISSGPFPPQPPGVDVTGQWVNLSTIQQARCPDPTIIAGAHDKTFLLI